MLTVQDVARELTVSATCVYQLIASGKLPCHRIGIGRGAIRVSEPDLAAFLDACRASANEAPVRKPRTSGAAGRLRHLKVDG